MFLSIVIPMYNVERYIKKCLESVMYQKDVTLGRDYEVIIINDGSTDKSLDIASKLISQTNGIWIVSQQNQGLGNARNNGIKLANGEYIWFIDSDDWIEPFSIRTVINKLNHVPVDVLKIRGYRYISELNSYVRQPQYNEDLVINGRIEGLSSLTNVPSQFNICRKSFLQENNLLFMSNVYHEDNDFIVRMYWFAKTVSFINTPLYYHRKNPNSITSIPNPKRAFDLIKVCESLSLFYHFFVERNDKNFSKVLSKFISISLNIAFDIINHHSLLIQDEFNHQLQKHKHLFTHLYKSRTLKYMIESLAFNFYGNYSGIYRFLNRMNKYRALLFSGKKISKIKL